MRVELEVATRPGLPPRRAAARLVPTRRSRDHTVKVRVGGLKPDRRYCSASRPRRRSSEVGRTQTAPPARLAPADQGRLLRLPGLHVGLLRRLQGSCSTLDPDVVVCGGDYIYDRIYSTRATAGSARTRSAPTATPWRATLARLPREVPPVPHATPTCTSCTGSCRSSPSGTTTRSPTTTSAPCRQGEPARPTTATSRTPSTAGGSSRAGGPGTSTCPRCASARSFRTYRTLRFGRNVELFMCDSRSYREDQPLRRRRASSRASDRRAAQVPRRRAARLAEVAASPRSRRHWKLVGNQLMIMPFEVSAGVKVEVDSWQGYHAQRNELLAHIERSVERRRLPDGRHPHVLRRLGAARRQERARRWPPSSSAARRRRRARPQVLGSTAGGVAARADRAADRRRRPGWPTRGSSTPTRAPTAARSSRSARARSGALPRLARRHHAGGLARRAHARRPPGRPRHAGRRGALGQPSTTLKGSDPLRVWGRGSASVDLDQVCRDDSDRKRRARSITSSPGGTERRTCSTTTTIAGSTSASWRVPCGSRSGDAWPTA